MATSFKMVKGSTLVVVTGLSGSGKSYMGPKLAEYLGDQEAYLDEDKSFKSSSQMPRIEFRGREVTLWDSEESVDIQNLRERISKKSTFHRRVVVTGFYLPPHLLEDFPVEVYIVLDIDPKTSLERRQRSKAPLAASGKFDPDKDKWMMENYTFPFYQKGLRKIEGQKSVKVHHIDASKSPEEVWEDIKKLF